MVYISLQYTDIFYVPTKNSNILLGKAGNRINGDSAKKLEARNGIANNKKPEVLVRPKQMKSNGISHSPVDVTDKAQQQELNDVPPEALLSPQLTRQVKKYCELKIYFVI